METAIWPGRTTKMSDSNEKRLEHIVRRMQQDTAVDPPAEARLFVKNLFRSRAVEPKTSAIRRLVAAITMELAPNKAAFGERSGSASAVRQMLFEAGDAAIDLRIEPIGKSFRVRGQVLGIEFSGAAATLTASGRVTIAEVNDSGGFIFEKVAANEYAFAISSPTDEISIESLTIK